MTLPRTASERGEFPMADGLLYYFPDALAWVSRCSKVGNDQHNPGQPMHWAMDKSTDHANKILRHQMEVGTDDADGIPHSVKVAWRALAQAQEDLMRRKGAPIPRNARKPEAVLIPHEVAAAMQRDGVTPYIAGFEPNEDGVIGPNCATGACGLD